VSINEGKVVHYQINIMVTFVLEHS